MTEFLRERDRAAMEDGVGGGRIGKLAGAVCALGASVAAIATAVALVVLTACTSAVHDGSVAAAKGRPTGSSAVDAKTAAARQAAAHEARQVSARAAAKRAAARKAAHCAHNPDPQRVIVSVRKQHAWMCAHHKLVYSTAVTTGMSGQWTETPTGSYQIQGRDRNTVLTLNTGATYPVRYWIPFDGPLFGFHDSSWQHFPYGSAKYKTDGSHGCVHMPLKAMKWLYTWSARTTDVHIF